MEPLELGGVVQTFDDIKQELHEVERKIACDFGIPVEEVRQELLSRTNKGTLKETDLIYDWQELYILHEHIVRSTGTPREEPFDLEGDWAALDVPPKEHREWLAARSGPDNGCVVCGVGGDLEIGDTPRESVTWRCCSCRGLVCRRCALTLPDRTPREYYHETLCSIPCWEKQGKPDE